MRRVVVHAQTRELLLPLLLLRQRRGLLQLQLAAFCLDPLVFLLRLLRVKEAFFLHALLLCVRAHLLLFEFLAFLFRLLGRLLLLSNEQLLQLLRLLVAQLELVLFDSRPHAVAGVHHRLGELVVDAFAGEQHPRFLLVMIHEQSHQVGLEGRLVVDLEVLAQGSLLDEGNEIVDVLLGELAHLAAPPLAARVALLVVVRLRVQLVRGGRARTRLPLCGARRLVHRLGAAAKQLLQRLLILLGLRLGVAASSHCCADLAQIAHVGHVLLVGSRCPVQQALQRLGRRCEAGVHRAHVGGLLEDAARAVLHRRPQIGV
mmetsp:Transcript_11550/g.35708  ORF Transcript_11550/g.35708 Transcript_11550/m.35708 type:complete len:316 (+) Transcript_11550:146-1093(+)